MQQRRQRAVSHVVGIALLVAIVTILAGTMAVYLGSFGDEAGEGTVPNAVLETSYDDRSAPNGHYLNITRTAGAVLDTESLRLDVEGAEATSPAGDVTLESGLITAQLGDEWDASETLVVDQRSFTDSTGTALETTGSSLDLEDATVRIVYERSRDSSAVIYDCDVAMPDCANREP